MDLVQYSGALGALIANLQSLEYSLRVFLHNHAKEGDFPLHTLKPSDTMPETAFSNWDTLGDLTRKYNQRVDSEYAVEPRWG